MTSKKTDLKEKLAMKKIIAAIVIIAMCLTFAACGAKETEKPADPEVTVSVSDTSDTEEVEAKPEQTKNERYIELSGKVDDTFIAEQDCYTENDEVILYFQKGITIRGDMLLTAEKVMSDLRKTTGLDFDKKFKTRIDINYIDEYFEKGTFEDAMPDESKIYIIVINPPEDGTVQYAFEDGAVLEDVDFDTEETFNQTMYHELAHVAHLRSGVDLSSTLNEGFAAYTADRTQRMIGMPSWDAIQFYSGLLFDDSVISEGEAGFRSYFVDNKDKNYQYGFRFVSFLNDVYGEDIFRKILAEATAQNYHAGYDSTAVEESINADTQQMISIIKSQTSEDVFDQFAKWYEENWDKEVSDYYAHLTALGLW